MGWLLLGVLLPCCMAYALVTICVGADRPGTGGYALRAGLALGIGLGLSSCTYFLWLMAVGAPTGAYRLTETVGFAGVVAFGLMGRRWLHPADLDAVSRSETSSWDRPLAVAFWATLALAGLGLFGHHLLAPHGGWDAAAMWNHRARFLFRLGDDWPQTFSPAFVHTDYPLLIPATNARCWSYLGSDPGWLPWLTGCCLTLATVAVLAGGVGRLRSRSQGLLAGITLLGTAAFVRSGADQYSDVPLAFFVLCTLVLFACYDADSRHRPGTLLLAGLCTGLAAWTKNEGSLFVLAVCAARCLVGWHGRGLKPLARDILWWAAGALPILAVVLLFKSCLAPPSDLISGQAWETTWARLLDGSRHAMVARSLAEQVRWVAKAFVVVLPLAFILLGPARHRPRGTAGLPTVVAALVLMLAGYWLVYVTTPFDLTWHLQTSLDRLLVQLWPSALLIFFLATATPEEVASRQGLLTKS